MIVAIQQTVFSMKMSFSWTFLHQNCTYIVANNAVFTYHCGVTLMLDCCNNNKSGMSGPDWNVPMVDIHLRKLLQMYGPGHA